MITLEHRDGVSVIWLDTPGRKVNTLDIQALRDMQQAFDDIQADSSSRAVAILSRKKDNFLAGVDISLFTSLPLEELLWIPLLTLYIGTITIVMRDIIRGHQKQRRKR